ncbi:probable glycosyltransferase At5g03795 isoform X1 [Vitis riparia]|uniref:probable glycosyltransferase At5g03795 isoform X1 n=1 Tax=Vitis riparia TaxID=96939 RepID=UPI00155B2EA0|nr:probable glycosyltransferase At5g03795 isoform X1 [Vitis riparia]
MARSFFILYHFSGRRFSDSFRGFFFIPTILALITSLFVLFYISSTSNLFTHPQETHLQVLKSAIGSSAFSPPSHQFMRVPAETPHLSRGFEFNTKGNYVNNKEVFHDRNLFVEDYKEMNRSFKIYCYPHKRDDPFANALLPVDFEPGGNYASESYFKKVLMKSHFITKDPSKADLFFLPFSIARLRHDPRVGVGGIQDFIRDYIFNISQNYPYWNQTGGADHFYVACHSIGRSAMEKADEVKLNAIQVVCSSSYFLSGYIAHKDASLPQIWPRQGDPPDLASSERKKLAFFAGSINSPVRERLLQVWRNDSEISVHFGRLTTPYADELLGSKFCLHVKGFEINTARIADSLYYGCVPVIIANHYDLPFADILNWKSFSIVVATLDIPLLKQVLKGISLDEYLMLQSNVLKVRNHFQWHVSPVDYDAFYMVMYELWLRRSSVRVPLSTPMDPIH